MISLIRGPNSRSGVNCVFVIHEGRGLKLYRSKWIRDRSLANQERLSRTNHAPAVYGKMEATIRGKVHFGFETEIVDIYRGKDDNERFNAALDALELPEWVTWGDEGVENIGIKDGNPVLINCADDLERDGSIYFD